MSITGVANSPVNNQHSVTEKPTQNHGEEFEAAITGEGPQKVDKSSTVKETGSFFENILNRSNKSTKPAVIDVKAKLADIKAKGRLVQSHPLPKVVKDYVQEVKSFLTDVKDHAFEHKLDDENLFEKMETIDKKLVDLGDQVLEEQKDELAIVANLGELQGLLIDFYI